MAYSNKEVSSLIIDYLNKVVSKAEVSADDIDSLNVAIDCLTEVFGVEKDTLSATIESKFNGKSLTELLDAASQNAGNTDECKTETVKINIPQEDAETKAKAEALKLEGNKAVASKDYDLAVEKYTEAIKILPTNAVYFANRAAAYTNSQNYDEAVKDAEEAIKLDPAYSKGYSRLAYAKYVQENFEESLEAYKKVLEIEGDSATEVTKRGYETAKKRVEESLNLEKSVPTESAGGQTNPAAGGGFPDFSSLMSGGLEGLMNNPQMMQAAQSMMSNPGAMEKIQSMMQNPAIQQMAEQFKGGNTPDFSEMMNNPAVRNMASSLFSGAGEPAAPKDDAKPE
ncbi:Sgt2p KNAG_0M01170 [Huiozyma naganishii CBS 8797]|uniref:SGTA homodimerisation domain-containing protein n=1 Tax=Huiozyma naganishii (strain ATCC MYA-139 / BCRC 22969 / CBS 8797 / KCTC 17520 / NBRC 10181 / NCYC 3082 / Yp74L-3) TaxID=1071383 RepID=J7RDR1_HUIN7|nr:hypothetical protein KNAG_0M01170 [Kazachstania naganishii CBS 8797]CCK72970.1 hypothetical protein KNAG_0M01170 [Kazachstania naganishii CBS 8797]